MIVYYDRSGRQVVAMLSRITGEDAAKLLATCHPGGVAALRKAIAEVQDYEAGLIARATPAQHTITWGDCYTCQYHGSPGLARTQVYGRVLTPAQILAKERAAGAAVAEAKAALDRIAAAYPAGWRQVIAYSRAEPAGETDLEHVANMTPVTVWEFAVARLTGWPEPWRWAPPTRR